MTQMPYGGAPAPQQPRTTPANAANDLLFGGGGGHPALKVGLAKAPNPPHTQPNEFVGGRIVGGPRTFEVKDQAGNPKTYPKSGQPILGVAVDVQTGRIDPTVEGDDGVRTLYVEGAWRDAFNSRRKAVVEAVRAAGRDGLAVGDELYIAWTHTVETGAPQPAVNYVAKYVPASASAANALLQSPAPAPQQTYAAPAPQYAQPAPPTPAYPSAAQPGYGQPQQPYAAPQPQHMTPEAAAALAQLGATPAQSTQAPY